MKDFKFKCGDRVVHTTYSTLFNDVYEVVYSRFGTEDEPPEEDFTPYPEELVYIKLFGCVRTTPGLTAWWVNAEDFSLYNGDVPSVNMEYDAMNQALKEAYPESSEQPQLTAEDYAQAIDNTLPGDDKEPQRVSLKDFTRLTEAVKNLVDCGMLVPTDALREYFTSIVMQKHSVFC